MNFRTPSAFGPVFATVLLIATGVAIYSVEVLFSVTTLFALLFLVAVVTASYAGTTLALERYFDGERRSATGPEDGPR